MQKIENHHLVHMTAITVAGKNKWIKYGLKYKEQQNITYYLSMRQSFITKGKIQIHGGETWQAPRLNQLKKAI